MAILSGGFFGTIVMDAKKGSPIWTALPWNPPTLSGDLTFRLTAPVAAAMSLALDPRLA
jgi:hypothetical protein